MGVICKYKFDSSIYADLIPEFNSGYSGYVITDEVEGNIIIRTIESDELPTLMRFGSNLGTYVEGSEVALLEILEMNTSELVTCYRMFRYCKNLTSITCEWNTSNVTRMDGMFTNCSSLTSLDVSDFDTSKVTHMNAMFNGCANLTTLDVSNFNTSNVTSMSNMFYSCSKLTSLDVSNFDTTNVMLMTNMFRDCSSLTLLDVSNFVTVNVTDMSNMFNECNSLTSLDVSNWDTSNVTSMSNLFRRCYVLNELDMSNWDTSKVTAMNYLFSGCDNLIKIDISNFDTSKVTDTEGMFISAVTSKLKYLNISNFDMSANTSNNNWMFNSNPVETVIMFNCNIDTINKIGELYNVSNNLKNATIYVDESLDQSQYTGTVPLKVYKEEKLEIKLNSPLLEEDTIEVVDGKICHVHRWDSMILDGNSNWVYFTTNFPTVYAHIDFKKVYADNSKQCVFCENILSEKGSRWSDNSKEMIYIWKWEDKQHENSIYLQIYSKRLPTEDFDGFKQYLSQNPLTIIYKLAEPYYEDITPLQSSLVLKTFLESSMTIDTILPIETKLSYRTNVPSISTLSTRATELAESDNVIHNLMNIIDDEVDE